MNDTKKRAKEHFSHIMRDAQNELLKWLDDHEVGDHLLPANEVFISAYPAGEDEDDLEDCLYIGVTQFEEQGISVPFSRIVECADDAGDEVRKKAALFRKLAQMLDDSADRIDAEFLVEISNQEQP